MPPRPEEPDFYAEPTQAARYGGYYEPPEPPTPWYRRPLALVAFGAIGVIVLGLVIFAVVTLVSGSPTRGPATTTTPTPSTTATPTTTAAGPTPHHGGGGGPTQTVTITTPEPSTVTFSPTTTTPEPSTVTFSPSTETSTVTQTVTLPPRRGPFEPRP